MADFTQEPPKYPAVNEPDDSVNQENKVYFRLVKMTGKEGLSEINNYLAEENEKNLNLSPEFLSNLREKMNSDNEIVKGFLYAPKNIDQVKTVIGLGGCYFHLTTKNSGVDFIWHDRKDKKFYFWGEKWKVIKAMNIINHRKNIISERFSTDS